MKYSTIFLDLDDTLIDTIHNTVETIEEIYNDYHLSRYFDSFDDFYKNTFRPNNLFLWKEYEHQRISKEYLLHNRFIRTFGAIDEINDEYALEINRDYLKRVVRKPTLIPGCIEILEYLKSKYKICILSNGFTEMQYDKIKNADLTDYFDDVILSDTVGINKPQRGIFDFAIKQTGISKEEVIMIGDNYSTDITGAHGAGIDQIWYNPKNLNIEEVIPTHTISSLQEIKNIL